MKDNMKKISTIFQIQWIDHSRGEVLHEVNPENQWVLDGEGIATRKWDGTACLGTRWYIIQTL